MFEEISSEVGFKKYGGLFYKESSAQRAVEGE